MANIKNIVFDIGNVLTDFRWREFLIDKGFDAVMIERIANASVKQAAWNEFDRGVMTEQEVLALFIEADPEIEQQLHHAYDNIEGMVRIREYAIDWIRELKEKGYHVYYLSNFSEKARYECEDSLAFLPYMDGGVFSYQEKLIKPQREIYLRLLEKYHLNAEECVFLDDTGKNVEAAILCGFHGICFETLEQVLAELKSMGVN